MVDSASPKTLVHSVQNIYLYTQEDGQTFSVKYEQVLSRLTKPALLIHHSHGPTPRQADVQRGVLEHAARRLVPERNTVGIRPRPRDLFSTDSDIVMQKKLVRTECRTSSACNIELYHTEGSTQLGSRSRATPHAGDPPPGLCTEVSPACCRRKTVFLCVEKIEASAWSGAAGQKFWKTGIHSALKPPSKGQIPNHILSHRRS